MESRGQEPCNSHLIALIFYALIYSFSKHSLSAQNLLDARTEQNIKPYEHASGFHRINYILIKGREIREATWAKGVIQVKMWLADMIGIAQMSNVALLVVLTNCSSNWIHSSQGNVSWSDMDPLGMEALRASVYSPSFLPGVIRQLLGLLFTAWRKTVLSVLHL